MRCVGEIDISRPRWSECPTMLVPLLLGNVKNAEPGAGERRFERGRQEARVKEQGLLARLREMPDGESRAHEAKQKIDRVRTFMGYREYPKYGMVSRYFVYKQALLEEAERLVDDGVLAEKEDISSISGIEETPGRGADPHHVDARLVQERRAAFRSYEALTPPRVFTSDGEVVAWDAIDVPMARPVLWSVCPSRPGSSKAGRVSCTTWVKPISSRTTSWSPSLRTPAGRPHSWRSPAW